MKISFEVNGNELGLLNSKCYVLEKTYDFRTSFPGKLTDGGMFAVRHKLEHPELGGQYLLFTRMASVSAGRKFPDMTIHSISNSEMRVTTLLNTVAYIYRPIQNSDTLDEYGLNIFNERGSLFYSSSKTPLRIKDVVPNPTKGGSGFQTPPFVDGYAGCMTLNQIGTLWGGGVMRMYDFPAIMPDGKLVMGNGFWGGGSSAGSRLFNSHAIVAYAPDLLPKWK